MYVQLQRTHLPLRLRTSAEIRSSETRQWESCAMEDWLEAGSLSNDEFDQLVRLTARYFWHQVDQFDHWKMPGPGGNYFFVDFSWETPHPDDPDVYSRCGPRCHPASPAGHFGAANPTGPSMRLLDTAPGTPPRHTAPRRHAAATAVVTADATKSRRLPAQSATSSHRDRVSGHAADGAPPPRRELRSRSAVMARGSCRTRESSSCCR
jgi:hypothetical protein